MSIIIKGLDMPKEGVWYNIVITSNGKGFVDVVSKDNALTNTESIQAVEISTPHGRLIDADALPKDMFLDTPIVLQKDIDNAPTILEAEE